MDGRNGVMVDSLSVSWTDAAGVAGSNCGIDCGTNCAKAVLDKRVSAVVASAVVSSRFMLASRWVFVVVELIPA